MSNNNIHTIDMSAGNPTSNSYSWWIEDDDELFAAAFRVVNYVQQQQIYRNMQNLRYARMYQNQAMVGLTPSTHQQSLSNFNQLSAARLTLNVVKSCIDTASAKIASNKPRPLFLTENGDYSLKRKAKLLTKYLEGVFDDANVYQVGQRVFIDACIFGTGAMKIYSEFGKIKVERIMIDEIICDDTESIYGTPRQLHQRKHMSREVLIQMFPEHEQKIRQANVYLSNESSPTALSTYTSSSTDQISVLESWHLPSGPNSKDGKHAICIDNCTLLSEEYKYDYFPFVFLRWSDRVLGFFGVGLAEELIGIQLEMNRILRDIQEAHHRMAVPRVFVDSQSKINADLINDTIGGIIKFTGNPPIFESPTIMNQEVYQYLESLYKKAYEITGISQANAASRKEPGITSGVAIREVNDIASERFILVGQRYEEFYMEAARKIIDISRDLYESLKEEGKHLSIKVQDNKFIQTIKWKDVDLDNDKFVMRLFPTSLLPSTPAGKLETVQDLLKAGLVGQDQALSLLEFPDIERLFSLQNAAIENIERMLEAMIDKGKYLPPEPFMNLNLALSMTQEAYLRARCDEVSEDRLELLRTFMDDCQSLLNPPQPPQAATPMAPPQAPPQAPPVQPTMAPTSPMNPLQ